MNRFKSSCFLFLIVTLALVFNVQGYKPARKIFRRAGCPTLNQCLSKWGYCGTDREYCGEGCRAGPCDSKFPRRGNEQSDEQDDNWMTARRYEESDEQDNNWMSARRYEESDVLDNSWMFAGRHEESDEQDKRWMFGRRESCPDPKMCMSKWGYCGDTAEHCGEGCKAGPCTGGGGGGGGNGGGSGDITDDQFKCVFHDLDDGTRKQRLDSLRSAGYKPENTEEAAVFLAHVYHETAGLKSLEEHCAPNNCPATYSEVWCEGVQPAAGKQYYGRGWIQLSYPCNYAGAGKDLNADLLANPDLVSQDQQLAVKTALWYFKTINVFAPAREGNFAETTRLINGKVECNNGPGVENQKTRVETYKRVRQCFGIGEPKSNPMC